MEQRDMDEHPNRIHYINYGIGVLMVVLAALIEHFNGGFWWEWKVSLPLDPLPQTANK
jgi:hypothetical protein